MFKNANLFDSNFTYHHHYHYIIDNKTIHLGLVLLLIYNNKKII